MDWARNVISPSRKTEKPATQNRSMIKFVALFLIASLGSMAAAKIKPFSIKTEPTKWTRLYCGGLDMSMSMVHMGGWLCRDPRGKLYYVMASGLATGPSVGRGRGVVLFVRDNGSISGLYAGGTAGLSALLGVQVGYFHKLGEEPGHMLLGGATFTLPADEMSLICSVQLTSPAASLISAFRVEAGTLMVMPVDHSIARD